jgi:hypothetical protein
MFLVDWCFLVSWVLALVVNSRVSKISYSYTALRALSGFVFEVLGGFCRFFFVFCSRTGTTLGTKKKVSAPTSRKTKKRVTFVKLARAWAFS